jgi:hypothetical protein
MNRTAWLLAGSILAGSACSNTSGPDPAEQIYSAALAQWNQLGPDSYDLVIKRQCVCQTLPDVDVTIQVRNGTVTARFYTVTGDPVEGASAALYPDVPGLFLVVRNAMDQDPVFLSAEYDQTYGHPVVIQLDLEGGRSDDNVVYTTLSLTPIT